MSGNSRRRCRTPEERKPTVFDDCILYQHPELTVKYEFLACVAGTARARLQMCVVAQNCPCVGSVQ